MSDEAEKREFLAEIEVMDLSPIRDKTFVVAVSTGDPNKVKFLCSTIHGPYNFLEMAQEVGLMWKEHQHHAKVVVLEKDSTLPVRILSAATVDYIEAHFENIIIEEVLANFSDEPFTCTAETVEHVEEEN